MTKNEIPLRRIRTELVSRFLTVPLPHTLTASAAVRVVCEILHEFGVNECHAR